MVHLVFVYGSLRQGEYNSHRLATAKALGTRWTEPGYALYSMGAYPAMVAEGQARVLGEVFEVDPDTLAALDRLEQHPDWYRRTRIRLSDGSHADAYLMPKRFVVGKALVPGGDWLQREG